MLKRCADVGVAQLGVDLQLLPQVGGLVRVHSSFADLFDCVVFVVVDVFGKFNLALSSLA